ncbi:cupin domain-containing protein [Haloprofundus halophilus]|uniref:cupin domain-containing protein n=1 Tax=Haloprofundus halophilus TaxID=2283527 RepID=UPI000E439866|nr:cupin domain-containing protein [Haloprofundus halophilus]
MSYRLVDSDAVDPTPDRPCELRRLTDAAGLEQMAVNRFRAEPGEQIPLMYHSHERQEEAFFVLSGTLFVETPEETFEVDEGCLFAVSPGDPQRAHNPEDADAPVDVLAIGAPKVSGDATAYDP